MKKVSVILLFGCFFSALKPVFGLWEKGKQVVTKEAEKIILTESFQEEYEAFKDELDQFKGCLSGLIECTTQQAFSLGWRAMKKGASLTPQIIRGGFKKITVDNQNAINRIRAGMGDMKKIHEIDDLPVYLAKLEEGNAKYPLGTRKTLKGLEVNVYQKIGRLRYNDKLIRAGLQPIK